MLVRTGTKVIMGEDRADGAVVAVIVFQRIGPPTLDAGLRSAPRMLIPFGGIGPAFAHLAIFEIAEQCATGAEQAMCCRR